MAGVEMALSAVGLAMHTFNGCIEAYQLFYTARTMAKDSEHIISKLQWEQFRLEEWEKRTGLANSAAPNDRLNWEITSSILTEQKALLTSAQKLKREYNLDIPEEESSERPARSCYTFEMGSYREISREGCHRSNQRPQLETGGASRLGRSGAHLGNTRGTIARSNLSVHEPSEVEMLQRILTNEGGASNTVMTAAATLKHIRLIAGCDKRPDEIADKTPSMLKSGTTFVHRLKPELYSGFRAEVLPKAGIEIAAYMKNVSLIGWRTADSMQFEVLEGQIQCLALLLEGMDDHSFHGFRCCGYMLWKEFGCFGLVYEPPISLRSLPSTSWKLLTLRELMVEFGDVPLEFRYRVAFELAEAVLQLHTAGWLHKAIRSENVVFMTTNGSTSEVFDAASYLVGYGYARPDGPDGVKMTELPSSDLSHDIYRHPQARERHA
ncbi:hypothetical protein P152DRAFT_510803 [Eremomyces bilateralis CBS 781.70]|uniref:Prion-inhibition and propagation HeLo domain-containing protein n=1 Tax=Eremomyces bilateralis CBS 781.70 TaxID=1392243 RepID=A0A6G1GI85_9PEZI|nr:uncharacterized protein P152DRAFT_510803 [Eremomyces bilateralis CBS 781.70]KAF1817611.1 hypothetical protein P152DRAFT_510803 [Eremomyces bilateralis CBS 781.70]